MKYANKKKRPPKTAAQLRRHAATSAELRYGVCLTDELLANILDKIQNHDGHHPDCYFEDKQSNTRSTWIVTHEGQQMRVVYDSRLKILVTFLPMGDIFEFPKVAEEP